MLVGMPMMAILLASMISSASGDCAFTIQLSSDMMSYALHSFDLAEITGPEQPLCISLSGCTDCRLIFEMTRACRGNGSAEDEECPGDVPYLIDNEEPKWEACGVSSQQGLTYQRCWLMTRNLTNSLVIWDKQKPNQESKMSSGFSVRVSDWAIRDDRVYRLEVLNMDQGLLLVDEASPAVDLYLMLAMPAKRLKHLNRLTADNDKCEYDLMIGPWLNPDQEDSTYLLMQISDSQPLFEAPLDSALYTLKVPKGCSPTLEVSLDPQMDWLNETQIVCDGPTFLATQAFGAITVDRMDGYYLQRFIYCPDHLINMQLSMVEMFDGNMTIDFLDSQQHSIEAEKIIIKRTRLLPFNTTVRGVYGAIFRWDKKGLDLGFIMNILVSASSTSPRTIGTSISSQTTKPGTTTKPGSMGTSSAVTKVTSATKSPTSTATKVASVTAAKPTAAVTGTKTIRETSTTTSLAIPENRSLFHLFSPMVFYFAFH